MIRRIQRDKRFIYMKSGGSGLERLGLRGVLISAEDRRGERGGVGRIMKKKTNEQSSKTEVKIKGR